jgi:hypothetical protein
LWDVECGTWDVEQMTCGTGAVGRGTCGFGPWRGLVIDVAEDMYVDVGVLVDIAAEANIDGGAGEGLP